MASLAALSNLPTRKTRIKPVSVKTLQKPDYDPENARLAIWPWLPCAVGIDKAHILSQIHYWLQKEDVGYMVEGRKWIYNGYKTWSEQLPWLSVDALGYHIRELERDGLILTNFFHNTPTDRRKWYTLDYEALALTTGWNPLGLKFKKSPEPPQDKNLENPRLDSEVLQNRIQETSDSSIYKDYQKPPKHYAENVCQKNDFVQKGDRGNFNDQAEVIAQTQKPIEEPSTSLSNLNEDKCSAAIKSKYVETRYSAQGFQSQEERDGFYQALLELGKHKSGVRSVVAWANAIIKAINAGDPCEYLNEYRRGEPVGTCEKQEWEIAPGRPYDNFVSYLKRRLEANHMSAEQAVEAVFKALRDVNEARTLWEGYKRAIANLKEDWDKQQRLGVSNAYIPAELLPDQQVSLSEVAEAMQQLQNSGMPTKTLAASSTNLLPTGEKSVNESADDQEENAGAKEENVGDRQTRLKAQIEGMRRHLKSGNPSLVRVAKNWIESHSDIVALVDGDIVDLIPPEP